MSGGTTKNNRRPARTNMNTLTLFKKVKAFVLDVDGVLTDGSLLLLDDGQQARTMYIRDGYALQLAVKRGYLVLVISGGESAAVRNRLNKLGVSDVHMAVIDKTAILRSFMQRHGLVTEEVKLKSPIPATINVKMSEDVTGFVGELVIVGAGHTDSLYSEKRHPLKRFWNKITKWF